MATKKQLMTPKDRKEILEVAINQFRRITRAVDFHIERLEAEVAAEPVQLAKSVAEFEKVLTHVLTKIDRVEAIGAKETKGGRPTKLQIDTSRAEVQRRLALLAEPRGTTSVPE